MLFKIKNNFLSHSPVEEEEEESIFRQINKTAKGIGVVIVQTKEKSRSGSGNKKRIKWKRRRRNIIYTTFTSKKRVVVSFLLFPPLSSKVLPSPSILPLHPFILPFHFVRPKIKKKSYDGFTIFFPFLLNFQANFQFNIFLNIKKKCLKTFKSEVLR